LPKILSENIVYINKTFIDMTFSDKQIFEALEKNVEVKDCFNKIRDACKELKNNTGCPDEDVDRFLEFTIGRWS
tara:strand:- start:835 stop:1056 length:222 start_codon:yes stop_codon:yes gene_type:complete